MDDHRPALSVEQLHTFAAVARYGHVTRAARAIRVSQSSVSQQVQRLETALGLPLLERVGRGVRLTDAGRAIGTAAGAAIAAVRAVEDTAAALRGLDTGAIAVAASNTVGIHRAPSWIAGFLERHPGVEVRLRLGNTADAIAWLRGGEVDLALVEGEVPDGPFEAEVLERDELVLVAAAGHPLARLDRIGVRDLRHHRYLSREDGSGTEALARRLVGDAYRTGAVLELGHLEAVRSGVSAGLGYAVLPRTVVAREIASGEVAVLPRAGRRVFRRFRAIRRKGPPPPAAAAFWHHLVREHGPDEPFAANGRTRDDGAAVPRRRSGGRPDA